MLAVGETLDGRYRIVREIGAGGMGTVYEGENLLIRRRVAIKVMRHDAGNHPELCARFEREAQIASQIPSDHITEVLDLGELDGGQRFIVMEYLVGESLFQRLERLQRLPPHELLGLVRQVLAALGAAHGAGVIHRDVKPDNVFILNEKAGHRDFVKLLDFGISKLRPVEGETPLTQSGTFVGTPSYMAPEQIGGGEASPLWDLYAVGVLLYRGLTGETPFKSQRLDELIFKVALGKFATPAELVPGLDPALDALVCRAMSRTPELRFQSAEHFGAAIDDWLVDRPVRREPSSTGPLHTPGGIVTSARPRAPEPQLAILPTTRLTTEVSAPARPRSAASWLAWATAGAVVFFAAALIAAWRSSTLGPETPLTDLAEAPALTSVGALTPQPAAAAPAPAPVAAEPAAPERLAPTPSVAPVRAEATAPDAPTTLAPAGDSPLAKPAAPPARDAKSRRRGPAPSAKSTRSPRSARTPAPPKTESSTEPSGSAPNAPAPKARPDWGY